MPKWAPRSQQLAPPRSPALATQCATSDSPPMRQFAENGKAVHLAAFASPARTVTGQYWSGDAPTADAMNDLKLRAMGSSMVVSSSSCLAEAGCLFARIQGRPDAIGC